MKIKKLILITAILTFNITSFLSCTVNEKDTINESIDLSLVKHNDWLISDNILLLINKHRLSEGKTLLKKDTLYASAYAVKHSIYMSKNDTINHNNFFIRSNGLKRKGAIEVSENLAYGYASAQSVVNAWLKSDPHKEVINKDFTHVGFGIIKSSKNRLFYTTLFYKTLQ